MKNQKGITLIALIITIIVMLILVGVSVTVALNGGLFSTAKTAADDTKAESEKERLLSIALGTLDNKGIVDRNKLNTALNGTEFTLNNDGTITSTKTGKTYSIGTRGNIEERYTDAEILEQKYGVKIGDKVAYNELPGTKTYEVKADTYCGAPDGYNNNTVSKEFENEDLSWRILGLNENGQIELVSESAMTQSIAVCDSWGVTNAISTKTKKGVFDTLCDELYKSGKGAESARCLNAEDINKLAKYDPYGYPKYGNVKHKFETDNADEMMNIYGDYYYSLDDGQTWIHNGTQENFYSSYNDGAIWTQFVTKYEYNIAERIKITTSDGLQMSNILSGNYWLATEMTPIQEFDYNFGYCNDCGLACINGNTLGFSSIWGIITAPESREGYIRPVVTLLKDVEFGDKDDNGAWIIE